MRGNQITWMSGLACAALAMLWFTLLHGQPTRLGDSGSPSESGIPSASIEVVYQLNLEHCQSQASDRATLCRAAASWARSDAYRHAAIRMGCTDKSNAVNSPAMCGQLVAQP